MLIDSHAHLDAPYFRNRLAPVLHRAREAGVEGVVTIGVTPSSSKACLEIAAKYRSVHASVGYHPHWADGANRERLAEVERLAGDPAVVALGEIGLDYHHFHSSKESQMRLFRTMLDIASAVGRPVIIHDRKAHWDVFTLLSGYRTKLRGGVIHCFSGDWDWARKYLEWGFYLSIPGPVTYPASHDLREVARKMPLERMLIETDAPHLTPAPQKGRRNEPAFVRYTAEAVAKLRNMSIEEVAEATRRNAIRIFGLEASV